MQPTRVAGARARSGPGGNLNRANGGSDSDWQRATVTARAPGRVTSLSRRTSSSGASLRIASHGHGAGPRRAGLVTQAPCSYQPEARRPGHRVPAWHTRSRARAGAGWQSAPAAPAAVRVTVGRHGPVPVADSVPGSAACAWHCPEPRDQPRS